MSSTLWMKLQAGTCLAGSSAGTSLKRVIQLQRDGQDAMKEQWEADEARAAAAAEELMAEEVYEAAKAAAKKAKKQKAKARKQQARSSATSAAASPPAAASEVSAGACLQDVEAMAALHYSSSSGSTSHAVPPDQDTAGLQTQLQQLAVHDSAMHALPVRAVLEEEVATSASAGGGFHAGTAQAYGVAQGGNASFLDQLFCCPITQVLGPSHPTTLPILHLPVPTHPFPLPQTLLLCPSQPINICICSYGHNVCAMTKMSGLILQ